MRNSLFMLFFLCICFKTYAQKDSTLEENIGVFQPHDSWENQVFNFAEVMPKFQGGGDELFITYVQSNVVRPTVGPCAKGTVFVQYIIEKDGSITNVQIAPGRGISPSYDQAAIDVIKKSPKWQPGIQNGQFVRIKKICRIRFT